MIDFAKLSNDLASAVDLPELNGAFADALAETTNGYYAAGVNRYLPAPTGVAAMGSGADYHYRNETDFLRMIERSRLADRDNMVVGQGVNRLVANIFQGGFTLDPQTGDADCDASLRELWRDWSTDADACDAEGEREFHDFECESFRASIVDGDQMIMPTTAGMLQAFEGHRMRNPWGYRNATRSRFVHGVELDGNNKRAAYWLTYDDVDPTATLRRENRSRRYPTRDPKTGDRQAFHVYVPKRMSQRRGVTAFAPMVLPLNYHDDLQFAAMVKAKVASFYAIIRERELGSPSVGGARAQRGSQTTTTRSDGTTQINQGGGPGMEYTGAPGETLKGFAPNIPNAEFFPHASLLMTFVAINLDLPLIVFMLDASSSNFSAWRGAIDQARMRMRQLQKGHAAKLHRPTFRWKVRQWRTRSAFLRAKAKAGVDIFKHRWMPARWGYIEPAKDAAANQLRLSSNQATLGDIATEQGVDVVDLAKGVVDGRALVIRNAIAEADAINAEHPAADVGWRELAYGHKPEVDLTSAVVANEVNEPAEGGDKPNEGATDATK